MILPTAIDCGGAMVPPDDDRPPTPAERRAYMKIVEAGIASGVIKPVCICHPKRTDIHACPIDPDDTPFTKMLMRLR